MATLFRFPPLAVNAADPTFLVGKTQTFAKLKVESRAGKRTVFLSEHTLLFVIKGVKLLHFSNHTLQVAPDSLVLLKKGIYVMAEYLEEGLSFEALLLFLPGQLLRSLATEQLLPTKLSSGNNPCVVFPANELIQGFRDQVRQYFDRPLLDLDRLLAVKQREILLLLMATGHRHQVAHFIREAISAGPQDLDFTVRSYLFEPVSLQDLANLSNRSLASFKRDFQRLYQRSPRQWINQQRLAQARLLLQNTDQRIAEIAQACGFESPSYFIRLFKKEYGLSPTAIRAKITMD